MASKKPISANNIHVTGDFIAGDQIINYYTGDFASLAEYYISPESVFQRVRTDDFIGRDWLSAKVDAFLNDPQRKSGAFLLIGDAGVGKTSFMAHLVKERRYLHLFAEQAPGQAMLQRAMQSLGSQLVTRYQIDPYKDRDTLNALSVFPDFLERILRLAASTLTEGEKIVIVCDALDEAGVFPDHFVFGLPKELPDGVYFILSQRPVNVKLPNFEPVIENLEAQGDGNLQDIEAYLSAVAKRPEISGQIRSKEYSEDFFIQTLKEKSQGVWMYLHYVIKEIESGVRAPLDLANLPTGLVGYYAEYWDAWRTGKRGKGEEAWDDLYAPLLTTLAAAQEAIPVDWLIQWADVTAKPREVTRLLTEHWRAFITEKEKDGQKTFTPYHLSFKDFITGRVDTSKLPPAQANLVKDLAAQTVDAHKRIVSVFETECKGEWEKLVEQDYPRLHLSAHLASAGEFERLRFILTEGNEKIKWAEAKEQKEETYAGYLNDLTYVWDYAEREQNYALAIRCMLIENSIHSLASNIPSELLAELVKAELWSYARCLTTIRKNVDHHKRAESIKLLAQNIPLLLHQEAFSVVHEIENEYALARALAYFTPYLNEELKAQSLRIARKIKNESAYAFALASLASFFAEPLKSKVLHESFSAVRKINSEHDRATTIADIAPYLSEELKGHSLTVVRKINDKFARVHALTNLGLYLNKDLKIEVLQEAFSIAHEIKDEPARIQALADLAPHLARGQKNRVLQEVLIATRNLKNERARIHPLRSIAPHLNEKLKIQYLSVAHEIQDESTRAIALAVIASNLNEKLKTQYLSFTNEIQDGYNLVIILVAIVPHLNKELKTQILQDAISAARKIKYGFFCARALTIIAHHLNEPIKTQILQEALFATRKIQDEYPRVCLLVNLAPYLNESEHSQIFQDALSAAQEINFEYSRTLALAKLSLYLDKSQKAQLSQGTLSAARNIIDNSLSIIQDLSELVPYLSEDLQTLYFQEVYSATHEIHDAYEFVSALVTIIPYLDKKSKTQAIHEIQSAALEINDEFKHTHILAKLIPYLDEKTKKIVLEEALSTAREFKEEYLLASLAPYLNARLRVEVLQEALSYIRETGDEKELARGLAAIIPYLDKELKAQVLQETLSVVPEIKDELSRANIMTSLVPQLSINERISALQGIFLCVSSFLYKPRDTLLKIIYLWEEIEFTGMKEIIIPFIRSAAQNNRDNGIEILVSITPALVHFRGPSIADKLYRTITDVTRWWP